MRRQSGNSLNPELTESGKDFVVIGSALEGQIVHAGKQPEPLMEFSRIEQKPRQLRLEIVDKRKEAIKGLKLSYPRYLLANLVKQ